MSGSRAPARWPLVLALTLTLASLAMLLWLRGRLARQEESALAGAVRLFEQTGALGDPENAQLHFREVEALATALADGTLIREVRVSKSSGNRGEHTVVPFHADLSEPGWRADPRWNRIAVGTGPDGWLYLALDRSNSMAVNRAIGAFSVFFILGIALLLRRQRVQEQRLSLLSRELEDRQADVVRLERLALAGQLSANIFHDIKKPILNIKHEVGDVLDSGAAPDAELLHAVQQQTELFLSMLRELGFEDFVRGAGDVAEWCDVRECLGRALRLVRYEQDAVAVRLDFPPELPLLFAPPHRLLQLFGNLAMNGYQAMDGRGELTITAQLEGAKLLLRIEDTGPGIPTALRESLFEPFVTGRSGSGGSGLGLYICRRIVEDLRGTISLVKGTEGAAFLIILPVDSRD